MGVTFSEAKAAKLAGQAEAMRARIRSLEASLAVIKERKAALVANQVAIETHAADGLAAKTTKVDAAVATLEADAVELRKTSFADARRFAQLKAKLKQKEDGIRPAVELVRRKAGEMAAAERMVELRTWRERGEGLEAVVRKVQAEEDRRAQDKARKQAEGLRRKLGFGCKSGQLARGS